MDTKTIKRSTLRAAKELGYPLWVTQEIKKVPLSLTVFKYEDRCSQIMKRARENELARIGECTALEKNKGKYLVIINGITEDCLVAKSDEEAKAIFRLKYSEV